MVLIKQVARLVRAMPFTKSAYRWVWRGIKLVRSGRVFRDPKRFVDAMSSKGAGFEILTTHSGIKIEIRRNIWDALIVEEVFVDKCYDRFSDLGQHPVVVDVGGYIGDFSLYAAMELNAEKGVVCEPMVENLEILRRNVERNELSTRIVVVPAAVSDRDGDIAIHVKKIDGGEIHASSHLYQESDRRVIPCISLPTLMAQYALRTVDLLKIDCEGAEYDIILGTPNECFADIRNLVMEITPIENYESKLALVIEKLRRLNYRTTIRDTLVFCSR
jgi:FkbM family methyltransferase